MPLHIKQFPDANAISRAAAMMGADAIRSAIVRDGSATVVLATGASQVAVLATLIKAEDIDWTKVTAFHLDEYIGIPETHPASLRRYLYDHFVDRLPQPVSFVPIDGMADVDDEMRRVSDLIANRRIAVCFAGIGENGHLAFNDPPANFETADPYISVMLDQGYRERQWRSGVFPALRDVPERAISMSIQHIMKSDLIVVPAFGMHKARAVKDAVEGPISPLHPASILQNHAHAFLLADADAASQLTQFKT
ncbi:MAG: 6-phosphogluconolactonase [Beijerinckiaceae bacterium]